MNSVSTNNEMAMNIGHLFMIVSSISILSIYFIIYLFVCITSSPEKIPTLFPLWSVVPALP